MRSGRMRADQIAAMTLADLNRGSGNRGPGRATAFGPAGPNGRATVGAAEVGGDADEVGNGEHDGDRFAVQFGDAPVTRPIKRTEFTNQCGDLGLGEGGSPNCRSRRR